MNEVDYEFLSYFRKHRPDEGIDRLLDGYEAGLVSKRVVFAVLRAELTDEDLALGGYEKIRNIGAKGAAELTAVYSKDNTAINKLRMELQQIKRRLREIESLLDSWE